MWLYVDGKLVTTFTDNDRPYLIGSLGLYCEDSIVRFGKTAISTIDVGSAAHESLF